MKPISVALLLGATAACAEPPNEEVPSEPATEAAVSSEPEAPEVELARSAWEVVGPEGDRYTTYLDEDGTYRDFRNDEPSQQGGWTAGGNGGVCFTPEAEVASTDCWQFAMRNEDGTILATQGDNQVSLRRIAYSEPEPE